MQRLNTVLDPLWTAARRNQDQTDVELHAERVDALIDRATAAPLLPAPPQLHDAGEVVTREVSATDIANLRIGRSIALATRTLLKKGAGNQRLAIAASDGDSQMTARGIRMVSVNNTAARHLASLAVLGGAGQCAEHVRVAVALARQRHVSAVSISAKDDDHGAALLMPERGQQAVVVDAWTTIPTSCLKADSQFADTYVNTDASGSPVPRMFNLNSLDRLRDDLTQRLGPAPIQQAMQEDFITQRNAEFKLDPTPRWVSNLPDAVFHEAANYISDEASRPVTIRKIGADGVEQPYAHIGTATFSELHAKAITDSKPLLDWMRYQAHKQAVHVPQHAVTLRRTHTDQLTGSTGVQAGVSVALRVTRRPFLRDVRLPSKNILYRCASGESFSTIDTEQSVIDTGLRGLQRAQQVGLPERFIADVAPAPDMTTALALYALHRLQQHRHRAPSLHRRKAEQADLQLLEEVLPHLPQSEFDSAMKRFSTLLPELHPALIADGARLWKTHWTRITDGAPLMTAAASVIDGWARHFDDAVIESVLRDALTLQHPPSRLIGAVMRHVLMLPAMQHRALEVIDVALAEIPRGVERDALLETVRREVNRIVAVGTRAMGLAMVARYR